MNVEAEDRHATILLVSHFVISDYGYGMAEPENLTGAAEIRAIPSA